MFNQPRTRRSSWSLDANHTNQTWTNVRCWARRQKIRFVLLDFVARASKQAPSAIFKKCAIAVTWYQRTTLLLSYYPKQPWQDGRALHGLVSSQEACFFFESFQLVYLHVKFLPACLAQTKFLPMVMRGYSRYTHLVEQTCTIWHWNAPADWPSATNSARPPGLKLRGECWLSWEGLCDQATKTCGETATWAAIPEKLAQFSWSGWCQGATPTFVLSQDGQGFVLSDLFPEASPASWRYHPHQDIRWVMGWSQHFRSTEDTPMFSTPVLWTTIPWKRKLNPYLTYLFGVRCQKARGVSPLGFHQPKDSRSCTSQGPPDSSPHEFCTAAGIVT